MSLIVVVSLFVTSSIIFAVFYPRDTTRDDILCEVRLNLTCICCVVNSVVVY
ncbi:hypothetical protein HERIO_2756 [Hepatospora eriocheir]|uniref:Uncharacterized protein n=1 Tax=Hepatospora eriocheir TaxID=1081669 RepID=A0A1X0QC58_9MICR|nr:hypothetical protein HERIO_2756 [Hepatospora eriocheir]